MCAGAAPKVPARHCSRPAYAFRTPSRLRAGIPAGALPGRDPPARAAAVPARETEAPRGPREARARTAPPARGRPEGLGGMGRPRSAGTDRRRWIRLAVIRRGDIRWFRFDPGWRVQQPGKSQEQESPPCRRRAPAHGVGCWAPARSAGWVAMVKPAIGHAGLGVADTGRARGAWALVRSEGRRSRPAIAVIGADQGPGGLRQPGSSPPPGPRRGAHEGWQKAKNGRAGADEA